MNKKIKNTPIHIDKDWLYEQIVNKNRTYYEIGNELGCSYSTIAKKAYIYEIPNCRAGVKRKLGRYLKAKSKSNKTEISKELLEQKILIEQKTYKKIALELKCSPGIIANRVIEFGIVPPTKVKGPKNNLIGNIYERLTVVECLGLCPESREYLWKCICSCSDKEVNYITSRLTKKRGFVKSCGCLRGESLKKKFVDKKYGLLCSGNWHSIVNGAIRRNLLLDITPEYISNLFINQKGICTLSGMPIKICNYIEYNLGNQTASLDRIDSSKGYIKGNLQWIHKDLNRMKSSFTNDRFIEMCCAVAKWKEFNQ